MTQMLELLGWDLKTFMINTVKALMEKVKKR
jgi:hypothetical protein